MKFVFDLDDTVCMTDEYSEEFINKFFKENNLPFKQIKKVSRFADGKFDWSEEEAKNWYKNYGDIMMETFPCKMGAINVLNMLHDLGHEIIIATARGTDWHKDPEKSTHIWLKNNNIKYDKIFFGRFDKEQICLEVGADVFVDDDLDIVKNVANAFKDNSNKKVFLMNSAYNSQFDTGENIVRVLDFDDFLNKLKDFGLI